MRTTRWQRWAALGLTSMWLAACGSDDAAPTPADATSADALGADTANADATSADSSEQDAGADAQVDDGTADFAARASVQQVYVTYAKPDEALALKDSAGQVLATGKADALGSLIFRKVPPGQGYRVHGTDRQPEVWSGPLHVLGVAESQPTQAYYNAQVIQPGYGYLTTRDGTKLAYFATLPGPADQGPYPTIIEYSGYDPAKPGNQVVQGEQEVLCDVLPVLCDAPAQPGALLSSVMGFATVSVNMRGTGCSGGAYDYFETLQVLDGYDVVETVAAQPWVLNHKVGMIGLSFPGISQLFVAKAKPPSLAAIVPMSVIGSTATTLVPGGMLNMGFALNWIDAVLNKAAPYGQGWEQKRVDAGDMICKDNQLLHAQRVDNVAQASDPTNWVPELMDPLNPTLFAPQIDVPVFLAGGFQDEQTGPFFHTILDRLPKTPGSRYVVYNGVHVDGYSPQLIAEWKAFLDIYVARRAPEIGGFITLLAPEFTKDLFGVALNVPPDRWGGITDWAAAKAKWESEPRVQVLVGCGGGEQKGAPVAQFAAGFADWPPGPQDPWRLYFQPDGSLSESTPGSSDAGSDAACAFRHDPTAGGRGILPGGGLWKTQPKYDWRAPAPGDVVAFETAPLGDPMLLAGTASVDLWVRVTETEVNDADLEVNLTEVLPSGEERFVQGGWLRASFRKLSSWSTDLWPDLTMLIAEAQPLKPGEWTQVRIPVAGFAHVFAKGSRIRLAIDTPGDSRVDWRFDLSPWEVPTHVQVAHSTSRPSSVLLPRLQSAKPPANWQSPACDSLRGQPCRAYVPTPNVLKSGE